ncbi:sensor histidine kinase [Pleomorphomonas sp. PLEO]|uniref:sensor histidine kinase n=1 Tax=Pleomorphomonas sp. PLEO TaxID=3239306 RepID=UPI00351E0A7F
MTPWRPKSLKWRLVGRLAVMQAIMLLLLATVILVVVGSLWRSGMLGERYQFSTIDVLAEAVERDALGDLTLRPTPELIRLRAEKPDLWFILRDAQGRRLTEGTPPPEVAPIVDRLDRLGEASIRSSPDDTTPIGIVRWVDTQAGRLQMLTPASGRASVRKVIATAEPLFLNVALPIIGLMALATLLVTPFVVRRAMAGLGQAAADAERIDIDRSGVRLSMDKVPAEVVPFVNAVNHALDRLDKGYEGHKRFLADAAHELRTPIAILTTRIASLSPGPERTRLLEDTTRLTILTGQLLDLQRLDQREIALAPVDLVAIAERIVLDIAPLAFAAGYEMTLEPEAEHVVISGDETALDRALANLIQNAIDHGGRRGTIMIRVARAGWIEVCDEGDGIPPAEREQIFEPFYRLRQGGRGAGLGLDLVQKIMRLHGGHIEVVIGPTKGACLRMVFPLPTTA